MRNTYFDSWVVSSISQENKIHLLYIMTKYYKQRRVSAHWSNWNNRHLPGEQSSNSSHIIADPSDLNSALIWPKMQLALLPHYYFFVCLCLFVSISVVSSDTAHYTVTVTTAQSWGSTEMGLHSQSRTSSQSLTAGLQKEFTDTFKTSIREKKTN